MAVLADLRSHISVARGGGLVARRCDRLTPRILRTGGGDGTLAWATPTHGQRAAGPGRTKHAGAARLPGAALRCADAASDIAVARGFRSHLGGLLSLEVTLLVLSFG